MSLTQTGLAAAIVGALLFFCTAIFNSYTLPRLLIATLSATILWAGLASEPSNRGNLFRRTYLDLPLAAFAAALLLSLLFSIDFQVSLIGQFDNFYGLLPFLACCALYYGAVYSQDAQDPRRMLRIALIAGSLLAVYGLLQWRGIEPFPGVGRDLPGGRIFSASGTPPFLGVNLVLLFPPALIFALSKNKNDRNLGILSGVLIGSALILSLSRGAYLGAAGGCALSFLLLKGPKIKRLSLASRLAAAVIVALILFGPLLASNLHRAPAIADAYRMETWHLGGKIFRHHPVLGSGPDTFKLATPRFREDRMISSMGARRSPGHAHNDIIQVAATMGLFGLLTYLALLAAIVLAFREALQSEKHRPITAGALLAWACPSTCSISMKTRTL